MENIHLKKLLQIDSIELLKQVEEYGAENVDKPTKREIVYTAFDMFFVRAFNSMLLNGLVSDSQRDSIILNLLNELDFDSIDN